MKSDGTVSWLFLKYVLDKLYSHGEATIKRFNFLLGQGPKADIAYVGSFDRGWADKCEPWESPVLKTRKHKGFNFTVNDKRVGGGRGRWSGNLSKSSNKPFFPPGGKECSYYETQVTRNIAEPAMKLGKCNQRRNGTQVIKWRPQPKIRKRQEVDIAQDKLITFLPTVLVYSAGNS